MRFDVGSHMNPSLTSLHSDAIRTEAFFCRAEQVNNLPFVHSFPERSCELVSAFLAVAVGTKYTGSSVEVAMAYSRPRNEWHFWVEVDNLVLDATAHQFSEYRHVLVCARPSPLELLFPDIERLPPDAALGRLAAIQPILKQSIVSALERELAA